MKKTNKKAFTLLEISIVLIVIGIIISAVMSGRDVISSSDSKQFYQTFARKYSTIIDGYYDRMGKELGDSNSDGYFDGVDLNISSVQNSGIDISKIISSNKTDLSTYQLNSQIVGYTTVKVKLYSYNIDGKLENFIILSNIPKDIAIAVDKYIDGISDGRSGISLAIQTSIDDETLPLNSSSITPLDIESLATNITNLAIMVEH